MKIVVAGGSGFIGQSLVEHLERRGEVLVLSRRPEHVQRGRGIAWSPPAVDAWSKELRGASVVVNLAGANVGEKRWSSDRKAELVSSRLEPTAALVAAMRAEGVTPRFLSASAVGVYGSRGDELLDEQSAPGRGFLPELAQQWEAEALTASEMASVAVMRLGVVLAPDGGALQKMLPPFRLGLGGHFGNGKQWMPWIDRRDVLRAVDFLIDHPSERGVFNLTAPHPVTNRDFSRLLGRSLGRPTLGWVPGTALKLAMGEMAEPLLLESQRVVPVRLNELGFVFDVPTLEKAFAAL